MGEKSKKVNIGDWVRFYRNGQLVIGVVEYFERDQFGDVEGVFTDAGAVSLDSVLEVRSGK